MRLEAEIQKYFGVQYVFLASSGKAALYLILKALASLSTKRQVIIPAYTCFSVPSAIVKAGLTVSPCDIDPSTLDFDQRLLEEAINEETLCVIPNHLFGIPCSIEHVVSLCRAKGVYVVEDAAQAMGESHKGKMLGTFGDVGFFSLGRGKQITAGSGGIIVTNSEVIARALEKELSALEHPSLGERMKELFRLLLLTIFIRPSLYWLPSGLPFLKLGETLFYKDFPVQKLTGVAAGLLRNWQIKLEASKRIRRDNAVYFSERLGLAKGGDVAPAYLRLPIMVVTEEARHKIRSLSRENGLGISPTYPTSVNEIPEIRVQFEGKTFLSAQKSAETILTIPVHPLLTEKDRRRICEALEGVIVRGCAPGQRPVSKNAAQRAPVLGEGLKTQLDVHIAH